jgi:hypothetical protein
MGVIGSRDRNRITIEGVSALVRLGYQKAATLGAWRVEGDFFTATVLECDGFRITQTPLTLEIQNKEGGPTRRPLGDVTVVQRQLSARLLPKRQEP